MILSAKKALHGTIRVPGDKSISHRSVMIGAIASGTTTVHGFLKGADCLSTISCFRQLGVNIEEKDDSLLIHGKGLYGLHAPSELLYTGNSGTTTRLISGILSAQNFTSILDGDASIQKRPMRRIIAPLTEMGADIKSLKSNDCTPLSITGAPLHGITYTMPHASAQVKSAILLAGLYAKEPTHVTESGRTRNHTELMLHAFGGDVRTALNTVSLYPGKHLYANSVTVPGDISSAAYFLAAGCLLPNSQICIENVGINETRSGILHAIEQMGGSIKIENKRYVCNEPVADLIVETSSLHGITIEGDIIPTLIDEIPILAVMAAFCDGTTIIKDAMELTVKESNRIQAITDNLKEMGADILPTTDGMIIHGGRPLHGITVNTFHDHRIAMSFAIAALMADGTTTIHDTECISISYPNFFDQLSSLYKTE